MSVSLSFQVISPREEAKVFAFMSRHYPPVYAHLWSDGGRWYLSNQYGGKEFQDSLKSPDVTSLWCLIDGEVIGWTQWETKALSPSEPTGSYLHRLYLATEWIGKGWGSKIVEAFEQHAKLSAKTYAWLEAMVKSDAFPFYEKLGYRAVHTYELSFTRMLSSERTICVLKKDF